MMCDNEKKCKPKAKQNEKKKRESNTKSFQWNKWNPLRMKEATYNWIYQSINQLNASA